MTRTAIRIAALLVAIHLPFAPGASAQGAFNLVNGRNHPELRWMEIRTPHFQIVYHTPLENWAREAASILERFHGPACRILDTYPDRPTRVYISDQDQIANGMAIGDDYFVVWIPSHPAAVGFSGSRGWFEEVLVHEYAHILTARASRTWLGNAAYLTGTYPPRWLHEGVSQWLAESWNVLRGDVTLSGAVLDEGMLRWPHDGRLLYATGNARVRWIASQYGDSTVRRLLRPAGPLGTYTYAAAHRRAFGAKGSEVFDRFRRSMIGFYGARYETGEDPDSIGRSLDVGLDTAWRVEEGSAAAAWWTGGRKRASPERSLFRATGKGEPERIIAGGITERAVPIDGGGVVVPRWHRAAHGAIVQDLFTWTPDRGTRRLTHGERIVEAAPARDGKLAIIEDNPWLGPAVLLATAAQTGARAGYDTVYRWPRGTLLHGIAASPSGARIAVSVVDREGRRSLVGFELRAGGVPAGIDAAPIPIAASEDGRGARFIDEATIVAVSFADGTSQIRVHRWPDAATDIRGGDGAVDSDSAGAPSLSPRNLTRVGAGLDLVGLRGDSVVAMDRSSRRTARLLALDPSRTPREGASAASDPYPFPGTPAIDPEARTALIDGPYPYRPMHEVRPWLHVPLAGPQGGRIGIGALSVWAEPLLRHSFAGFVYTSDRTIGNPDRGLLYVTTRFGPWAFAYHASHVWPRRIWGGRVLLERQEATGIWVEQPLHASGDPNVDAWLSFGADVRTRWPRGDAALVATAAGTPRSWSRQAVRIASGRVRIPAHGVGPATLTDGDGILASFEAGALRHRFERFARGRATAFFCRPARGVPGRNPILWVEGNLRAASAGLPPQEYEGLDEAPAQGIVPGWSLIDGSAFLRGWPEPVPARGVAHAALEIRFPILPDLGTRLPGLRVGGGAIGPFLEGAGLWGAPDGLSSWERFRGGYGIEARWSASIVGLRLIPSLAYGLGIGRGAPEGNWSFRVAATRPAGSVIDPPTMVRGFLGSAIRGF